MTDLTLTAIQALSPEEQEWLKKRINLSNQRIREKYRHNSAINRQLETSTDFERNEDEREN